MARPRRDHQVVLERFRYESRLERLRRRGRVGGAGLRHPAPQPAAGADWPRPPHLPAGGSAHLPQGRLADPAPELRRTRGRRVWRAGAGSDLGPNRSTRSGGRRERPLGLGPLRARRPTPGGGKRTEFRRELSAPLPGQPEPDVRLRPRRGAPRGCQRQSARPLRLSACDEFVGMLVEDLVAPVEIERLHSTIGNLRSGLRSGTSNSGIWSRRRRTTPRRTRRRDHRPTDHVFEGRPAAWCSRST